MSVLDGAPRASFDKIEFPFTSRTATMEARHHLHEFPDMAAADVEKLGRKGWVFTFECPMHAGHPKWPGLYPEAHRNLIDRATRLDTATLVVPELGEIRCMITKLDSRRKGGIKSGEDITLVFIEDDLTPLARRSALASKVALEAQAAELDAYLGDEEINNVKPADIAPYRKPLGSLLDSLNSVLAIRDQLDLYGQRVRAQLAQIKGLCRQVHGFLSPATLDPVRQLLRDIWDAAATILAEATGADRVQLVRYVVPRTMSVGAIAQSRLGTASRGGEVLSLNSPGVITDPFSVPAGSQLVLPSR